MPNNNQRLNRIIIVLIIIATVGGVMFGSVVDLKQNNTVADHAVNKVIM